MATNPLLAAVAVALYGNTPPTQDDLASGGDTMAALYAELPALLAVLPAGNYVVVDPENTDQPAPAYADSVQVREYTNAATGEYTLVSVISTSTGPGLCLSPNGSALASAISCYVVPEGYAPQDD